MSSAAYAAALRAEICTLNHAYATRHALPHELSRGESPVVLYLPHLENEAERHGNFLPRTYRAILQNENWRKRLAKVHTAKRGLPGCDHGWKELDSCTSSDALLMNVFCCPGVFRDGRVYRMIGVEPGAKPEFGISPRVALAGGAGDRTEVDMRIGNLLVEAKLTEFDFQAKAVDQVARYRDLAEVFEARALPLRDGVYEGYQLIRNVLAAHAAQCAFCVILDARRPDLLESWYEIIQAVHDAELRTRLQVLTWQELSTALPPRLQSFLREKYGI